MLRLSVLLQNEQPFHPSAEEACGGATPGNIQGGATRSAMDEGIGEKTEEMVILSSKAL